MRDIIFLFLLFSSLDTTAQDYKSIIIRDDTLSESGNDILVHNDDIYIMARTGCQPNAQSCGRIRKLNSSLELGWAVNVPFIRIGNENALHMYRDSIIIAVGVRNLVEQEEGYYHYELSKSGDIINLKDHLLPYESNFNYGSIIIDNVLNMYGASEEDVSNPEIDVDALISTYNFITGEESNDYFDYNNLFVDIFDLQADTDSTLVFFSRRRQPTYQNDRDYVIEKINPDGSRYDLYKVKVEDDFSVKVPTMEVLSDGKIAFIMPNLLTSNSAQRIRYINGEGVFLFDIVLSAQYWPDIISIGEMSSTSDGGILLCGKYADRTDIEGSIEFNGMLLKISGDGELLWTRQYRQEHGDTGEYTKSIIISADELPNGDIIATGNVRNITSDLWVLKVDNEGCFGEDNCGETTVGIEEEIFQKSYVNVYPNPVIVGQDLQVEVSSQVSGRVDYQVVDLQGRSIMQGFISNGQNSINTSQIPPGINTLVIDLGKRGIESHKIVIN